ncbi:MAG: hypothetical protein K8M05_32610 [Deltaproteobacteria bacterium]|nr:hypothetical protein [Kofleriaceae bacterium]
MRGVLGHIELAGFVITKDEWQSMDPTQRAQLLRAATRRDEPWVPSAPPPLRTTRAEAPEPASDAYELYEITAIPA